MRERAESVGGHLEVNSQPGQGTEIRAWVRGRGTTSSTEENLATGPSPEGRERLRCVEPRRLLLVDDHALFRDGLARLFAYEDDFEVVGEAADGDQALGLAHLLQPDLVLMDVDMPRGGGIAATRRIKADLPATRVVMLTVHDDDDTLFQAIKAGAQGFLVKSIRTSEMLELLRGMAYGEAPLSRAMAARILEEFARGAAGASDDETDAAEGLTLREEEVLELVSQRYTNKEIAQRLVISEYTVKNHLSNILSKLHLRSRAEAARYAATQRRRPSDA